MVVLFNWNPLVVVLLSWHYPEVKLLGGCYLMMALLSWVFFGGGIMELELLSAVRRGLFAANRVNHM